MRPPCLQCLVTVALAALVGACGNRETQLVVVTYTDLAIPAEMDSVEISATGPGGMAVQERSSLAGPGTPSQPFTLGLHPAGEALGPVTVTVRGMLGTTEVVSRTAVTSFVKGESRVLRLDLRRACAGSMCAGDRTCVDGACVSPEVPADRLPPWEGTLPGCEPTCRVTDAGGRDAGLPADGGPDASADGGPSMDAGPMDAGPMDAGLPDAGPPDAGLCDPRYEALPSTGRVQHMGELTAMSLWFHRPSGEACPESTSSDDFAYEVRTFCNPGPRRTIELFQLGYDFDMTYTLIDPWIVVYSGDTIPVDAGECILSNDDSSGRDSRVMMSIGPGEVITVVTTSWCPARVTSDCSEPGFGTYVLRIDVR